MSEQRQALRASRKKAQTTQNLIMLVVGVGLVLVAVADSAGRSRANGAVCHSDRDQFSRT